MQEKFVIYKMPIPESSPEIIPVGETCHAQECIGVENPGDFRLTVSMYDTTGTKQRQTFLVKVG